MARFFLHLMLVVEPIYLLLWRFAGSSVRRSIDTLSRHYLYKSCMTSSAGDGFLRLLQSKQACLEISLTHVC